MCKDTYIYTHVCAHTLKHTYAHILTLTLIGIDTIHIQHTTYNTHTQPTHVQASLHTPTAHNLSDKHIGCPECRVSLQTLSLCQLICAVLTQAKHVHAHTDIIEYTSTRTQYSHIHTVCVLQCMQGSFADL
jgi:hypothetical protein